ncbi:MAG: acyl-CoA synthetase FdrA [Hyphomicrobiaceae bacterium]
MSVIINQVRKGAYIDSVALMRIAQRIKAMPGIDEAGLMVGTSSNRDLLADAGILDASGRTAGPGDLIIAVRAATTAMADAAIDAAVQAIDASRRGATGSGSSHWQPRTLRTGLAALPDANLALVSVPGEFAAAEGMKALGLGLNIMIFSDNVSLADEITLKQRGRQLGLLVMGPDCGTAIIGGVPIAFANVVPRGDIGIVGASGTGIQEVSCLIAKAGGGVSHAIGTGGRDLKAEVGGITTLMAIDLLDQDPTTRQVVLISKPPADSVARIILERVARSPKSFTICFLGAHDLTLPGNAKSARTLEAAALLALGRPTHEESCAPLASPANGGRRVAGLFVGGTLCSEAQIIGRDHGARIASNVPVPGANLLTAADSGAHSLIDLGDDAFTLGRPHPMIEPGVRDAPLLRALADAGVGVVLLDVVLGTGSHPDPAGHLAAALASRPAKGPHVIASITGTDADHQGLAAQTRTLEAAGVRVAASNAAAARMAFATVARQS